MIERYSLPKMRSIWSEQRKLEIWLEIETLACEGMAELGIIPKEAVSYTHLTLPTNREV